MTENSEINWNKLIEQYREGTISKTDRYTLEKKALDDPFLFDALEGFSLYEENSKGGAINKEPQSRIFTIPRLAAAASLVFLLSMVFLLKDNGTKDLTEDKSIAMAIENEANNDNLEEPVLEEVTTTTSPAGKSTKEKKKTAAKPKYTPQKQNKEQSTERAKQDKEKVEKDVTTVDTAPKNTRSDNTTSDVKDEYILASAEEETAPIKIPTRSNSFEANAEGDVAMADTNSELENVINTSKKKESKPIGTYYIASPMIGKSDFDDYVQTNIIERGLKQSPSQEIIIEFSIDMHGNISDFTHITSESSCPKCASHAINMLQNSGEWSTTPAGQTGRVRYKFNF